MAAQLRRMGLSSLKRPPAKGRSRMNVSPMLRQAPGPPGYPLIGNLLDLWRDVLGSLLKSRQEYGDVVRFKLGPMVLHLLAQAVDGAFDREDAAVDGPPDD